MVIKASLRFIYISSEFIQISTCLKTFITLFWVTISYFTAIVLFSFWEKYDRIRDINHIYLKVLSSRRWGVSLGSLLLKPHLLLHKRWIISRGIFCFNASCFSEFSLYLSLTLDHAIQLLLIFLGIIPHGQYFSCSWFHFWLWKLYWAFSTSAFFLNKTSLFCWSMFSIFCFWEILRQFLSKQITFNFFNWIVLKYVREIVVK